MKSNKISISNFETKKRYAFLAGGILGAIIFMIIYGTAILDVTSAQWLISASGGDTPAHYLGWEFFRASDWHFPMFGLMDGVVAPESISIIYTDSVPLFAVFFKLLSPILPETFQYFGIYGITCFFLQGALAALIIHKYNKNFWVYISGAAIFTFVPIMLFRLYVHSALASQWILLLGIYLLVSKEENRSLKGSVLAWTGTLVLCTFTHMYFLPMIGIMLILYVVWDSVKNKKVGRVLLMVGVPILSALLCLVLLGAFHGESNLGDAGLGAYSANLNALVNPTEYWEYSKIIQPFALTGFGQVEGFAYLGLGVIVAVIVALVLLLTDGFGWKKLNGYGKMKRVSYLVMMLLFMVLALSPTITFFDKELFTIPYPEPIIKVLSIFRASGRFIWPIVYSIMLFAVIMIARSLTFKKAVAILLICLGIQFVDMSGYIGGLQQQYYMPNPKTTVLRSSVWEELGEKYDNIMFIPNPGQVDNAELLTHYGFNIIWILQYAAEEGLSVNDSYVSRRPVNQINQYRMEEWKNVVEGNANGNTIFFFPQGKPELQEGLLYFYEIDGLTIGVKDKLPGIPEA